jgi:hypothetical protein
MLFNLPLPATEVAVLRFTQLRLAARAYDAERVLDIAKRAYRDARESVGTVQLKMRQDDRTDADLFMTAEENNDRLEHSRAARMRRAFVGVDLGDVLDDEELLRMLSAARW